MSTNKITFMIIDPEAKDGEWGSSLDPSPYVGLSEDKLTNAVGWMQDKFDVVIDKPKICVLFDYPLAKAHKIYLVPLFGAKNFTRVGLAKAIAVKYQEIYAEEAKTSEESIGERLTRQGQTNDWQMANRAKTNGKWGIWGHDLSDLDLHTVTYNPEMDLYTLGIDS